MEFNVGDRVKIVNSFYRLSVGDICKVICVDEADTRYPYQVSKEEDNLIYWIAPKYIERVKETTVAEDMDFNVSVKGNTVTVTDNKTNKVGVAKCSPKDSFNLLTGIGLAVDRMMNQPWKPSGGECYFFIDEIGNINRKSFFDNKRDALLIDNGNYFKTEECAEKALDKLNKFMLELEHQ